MNILESHGESKISLNFLSFIFSPYRIFDDLGSAFGMGLIGGSIFHSFSAYRNAAANQKMRNILKEVRLRSPVTGGQFAAWGGMFSTIDCTLVAIRKKVSLENFVIYFQISTFRKILSTQLHQVHWPVLFWLFDQDQKLWQAQLYSEVLFLQWSREWEF